MTLSKPKFCLDNFFNQKERFFEDYVQKLSNISIPEMRISQNLDLFLVPLPVLNFVCCPFPLFFLALLVWLPFALHVLSGCREKLDVNHGRSLDMDLDQS